MVMINIPENLAKVIEKAAQRENRSLDELVISTLKNYFSKEILDESEQSPIEELSALDALMGLFDDDVTDMSSRDEEILKDYYKNRYDQS